MQYLKRQINKISMWLFIRGIGKRAKEYSRMTESVDRAQFLMRAFGIQYIDVIDGLYYRKLGIANKE